jgi:opacity protein-like surface antigen
LGGQIRGWLSTRLGAELSLERRNEENATKTEKAHDRRLQASLLVALARSSFSPYVLGGVGWYTRTVDTIAGDDVAFTARTRRSGSHAGFGAELRAGRHAALHGDYRYTFLRFGDDPATPGTTSSGSRFLPSYEGSMWTAGLTIYF